jgi:type II secretory pathway predicted ATPase ExeA
MMDAVGFGDPAGGEAPFVMTNVARHMMGLIEVTHQRQRMSAFAGPVGIGKTRAISALADQCPKEMAVVKIAGEENISEIQFLLSVTNQLRSKMGREHIISKQLGRSTVRRAFRTTLVDWVHNEKKPDRQKRTLIIDEAQSLSRGAITGLRFWNDQDDCLGPYPLGIIFVGNHEFALRRFGGGQSTLSLAVADRLLYMENYKYEHVADEDIRSYIEAFNVATDEAIDLLIRNLGRLSPTRSLRSVNRLLDDLKMHADGGPLDGQAFQAAFRERLS